MNVTKRKKRGRVVQVTADDIAGGERRTATRCPVTYAVARAFRLDLCAVSTGYNDIFINGGMHALPARVKTWIAKFDYLGDAAVKPFKFRLRT